MSFALEPDQANPRFLKDTNLVAALRADLTGAIALHGDHRPPRTRGRVMPTTKELARAGRANLKYAIERYGGFAKVAERVGLTLSQLGREFNFEPDAGWSAEREKSGGTMLKRLAILGGLVILTLAACSGAEPTPDQAALEATVAQRIFATLTASAPTATPIPQNTNTVAPAPSATSTPVPPTATPTSVPTLVEASSTPTATPVSTATSTPAGPTAVVRGQTINVRAGPSTAHPVIGTAKQGETLEVTARTEDQKWIEVRLPNGKSGWVSSSLVDLNTPTDQIALAASVPTPPLAPTATATVPPAIPATATVKPTGKDLEVTFINPNYDCQQGDWESDPPYWGYRSFQADMYIKNNSQQPIEPPWKPKRWIITDGVNDYINDMMWQWGSYSTGLYDQPTIQPGQSAGWTFLAFPVDRNQWVRAVEYVWNGQVYRQEFDLGTYGNAYNYKDCGEPRAHKDYPTPTPMP